MNYRSLALGTHMMAYNTRFIRRRLDRVGEYLSVLWTKPYNGDEREFSLLILIHYTNQYLV